MPSFSTSPAVAAGWDDLAAQDLPTEPEGRVPFSKENRMTTFLVAAVVLLCTLAVMGVRVILKYPSANSTPAWVFLGGSVVLALKILLSMLQTEFARRDLKAEAQKTRHDLRGEMNATKLEVHELAMKANGGLTAAVKEVGEQVRAAEKDQAALDLIHRPEFQAMMADICSNVAQAAAVQAARKVCDEMKGNK